MWINSGVPVSYRNEQFEYCLNAATNIRKLKPITWESVLEFYPKGKTAPGWQATRERLAAMILQVGLYGILQPVFADTHPEEWNFRCSKLDRRKSHRNVFLRPTI